MIYLISDSHALETKKDQNRISRIYRFCNTVAMIQNRKYNLIDSFFSFFFYTSVTILSWKRI